MATSTAEITPGSCSLPKPLYKKKRRERERERDTDTDFTDIRS